MDTWDGVTVGGTPPTVTELVLSDKGLNGTVPAALGDLTALETLNLFNNILTGPIPAELGQLTTLETLNLRSNSLTGSIPAALGDLNGLTHLNLGANSFEGISIPAELGQLTTLRVLHLDNSLLISPIPDLSGLTNLEKLYLHANKFTGPFPTWLDALTNLTHLHFYNTVNLAPDGIGLTGSIPDLSTLTYLEELIIDSHSLTGGIPTWLGDLTNLTRLDLDRNKLTGLIPVELGQLANLQVLDLNDNQLTGAIPAELGDLTNLTTLWLSDNQLEGAIPPELGQLTYLTRLWISANQFSGAIPVELGGLMSLERLSLRHNQLSGAIPPELGQLTNLEHLFLDGNQLEGAIPVELGQLSMLLYLYLHNNNLSGPIPAAALSALTSLQRLILFGNPGLTGPITALKDLPLTLLYLDDTQWSGTIPQELLDRQTGGTLTLRTNRRPIAPVPPVEDQVFTRGEMFTYTFPAFTDPDGHTLAYSAAQENGRALPTWLTFTSGTLTFSGTASTSVTVKVTATDTPLDTSPALDASVTFRIGSPPPPRRPDDDDSSSENTSPSVTGPTHVEYAENATQPVAAYTATNLQTPTWRVNRPRRRRLCPESRRRPPLQPPTRLRGAHRH